MPNKQQQEEKILISRNWPAALTYLNYTTSAVGWLLAYIRTAPFYSRFVDDKKKKWTILYAETHKANILYWEIFHTKD